MLGGPRFATVVERVLFTLVANRLVEADTQARVQEAVFLAAAHVLNLEVDLLLFDTTSTSFQRDTEETGPGAFRVNGGTPRTTGPICRRW